VGAGRPASHSAWRTYASHCDHRRIHTTYQRVKIPAPSLRKESSNLQNNKNTARGNVSTISISAGTPGERLKMPNTWEQRIETPNEKPLQMGKSQCRMKQ
jgi:hypothetical protein